CAEFIKVAREIKLDAVFVNISFVGTEALAQELGREGSGVVVTQVVPFPTDTSISVVARYQAAHKALKAAATPGFVSLEAMWSGGWWSRRSRNCRPIRPSHEPVCST